MESLLYGLGSSQKRITAEDPARATRTPRLGAPAPVAARFRIQRTEAHSASLDLGFVVRAARVARLRDALGSPGFRHLHAISWNLGGRRLCKPLVRRAWSTRSTAHVCGIMRSRPKVVLKASVRHLTRFVQLAQRSPGALHGSKFLLCASLIGVRQENAALVRLFNSSPAILSGCASGEGGEANT